MNQFVLRLSVLFFCISSSFAQQTYKPKDGGADSVVLNIWGTRVKGYYLGQYIKKINGEKGFYPHGTGKFTATIESVNYDYSGDFSEGKITGSGSLNGIYRVYEGALVDGMPNGIGKIIYNFNKVENLAFREGNFVNGKLNGKGKTKYLDGSKYEGDHVNDIFQGQGKFAYPEGKFSIGQYGPQVEDYNIYIGQWVNNLRNGLGTTFYKNGEKLEGNWGNDMFNGMGSITDNLGRTYVGNFKDGKYSGEGTLTNPDGSKMAGIWNEGLFTGFGTDIYSNGNKYVGNLVNGVKQGRGKFYFKNGAIFDGEWNDHFTDGIYTSEQGVVSEGKFNKDNRLVDGKKTWPDGDYYKGIWNETEEGLLFSGTARRMSSNGSIWEGEWMGDGPFLQGVVTYSNKDVYKGHWGTDVQGDKVYWVIAGIGELSYANGNVYSGEFENSMPHGFGTLTYSNNRIEKGQFVNGSYLETGSVIIGTQIWKTANLNVSKFRNGDVIKEAKNKAEWEKAGANKQPVWCYSSYNPINAKFGKIYNYYALNDNRGLVPTGWHIPSSVEWNVLLNNVGGNSNGQQLLAEDGFSALLGGYCSESGTFQGVGQDWLDETWWSSTTKQIRPDPYSNYSRMESVYFSLSYRNLGYERTYEIDTEWGTFECGRYIRLIKD